MKIRLQVKTSSSGTFPWEFAGARAVIGRDPDCELSFPDDQASQVVSWQHAQIDLSPRGALLRDLDSTNGTFVDGAHVGQPIVLSVGDEIRLGQAGPCMHVTAIELASSSAPLVARDRGRGSASAATGGLVQSTQPSGGTRAMLFQLERQHRASLWILAAIAVVALVAISVVALAPDRSAQHVATDPQPHFSPPIEPTLEPPKPLPALSPVSKQQLPEEKAIRRFDDAVALVGFRVDQKYAITDVTVWACRDKVVVCPTAILEGLKQLKQPTEQGDETLVVCTPKASIAILNFQKGTGLASGFSVAALEAPLPVACHVAPPSDNAPAPGQKLAVLFGAVENHDPKSIRRGYAELSLDRIQRADDGSPTKFHAVCAKDLSVGQGSPVFDSSGHVVGCVESAANGIVQIVPSSRLASLLEQRL